ncbi:MAG: hypothetical protein EA361_09195 [Bacteroidetes bacterium]|nr:MAG: hypothetical protein EA361_09195 [Bacteroidota bacterium]
MSIFVFSILKGQNYQLQQFTFSTGSSLANPPLSSGYILQGSVFGVISGPEAQSAGYRLQPGFYLGPLLLESPDGLLSLKVFLEGPFNSGSGQMNTDLHAAGLIPLAQPYNQLPWNYAGSESVGSIPSGVVDWLLVELRDAPSAAQATSATILSGWPRAFFLKADGSITALDGSNLPQLNDLAFDHNLYVVVRHRNHLAVMSSGGLPKIDDSYTWDFTNAITQAYMSGQKLIGAGAFGMFGGDGDANGQVQTQDKNNVWNLQSGLSGYLQGDFDLNGQVQTQDKNNVWNPNSGIGTSVP